MTKIGFKGPCLEKISLTNKQILYGFKKFKVNKKGFKNYKIKENNEIPKGEIKRRKKFKS